MALSSATAWLHVWFGVLTKYEGGTPALRVFCVGSSQQVTILAKQSSQTLASQQKIDSLLLTQYQTNNLQQLLQLVFVLRPFGLRC
jgi:hypothetical protein